MITHLRWFSSRAVSVSATADKKPALIEKYTADIPLPDLRSHIADACERVVKKAGTDPCAISYPDLLKAHLDRRTAETPDI